MVVYCVSGAGAHELAHESLTLVHSGSSSLSLLSTMALRPACVVWGGAGRLWRQSACWVLIERGHACAGWRHTCLDFLVCVVVVGVVESLGLGLGSAVRGLLHGGGAGWP